MIIQNAVIFLEEYTGKETEVLIPWIESIAEPQNFIYKDKRKYYLAQGDYIFVVEDVQRFGLNGPRHSGCFGTWFRSIEHEFNSRFLETLRGSLGDKYNKVLCFSVWSPREDQPPHLFVKLLLELAHMFRGPIMVRFEISAQELRELKCRTAGYIGEVAWRPRWKLLKEVEHIVTAEFIAACADEFFNHSKKSNDWV